MESSLYVQVSRAVVVVGGRIAKPEQNLPVFLKLESGYLRKVVRCP